MNRTPLTPSRGRRGSVFVLVLAVLSVLALLMVTLSYMSQMDLLASRNLGNMVQARMAAVTGVPLFNGGGMAVTANATLMAASAPQNQNASQNQNTLATLDPVKLDIQLDDSSLSGMGKGSGTGVPPVNASNLLADATTADPANNPAPPLATSVIEDESAKININAVVPNGALETMQRARNSVAQNTNRTNLQYDQTSGGMPAPQSAQPAGVTPALQSISGHGSVQNAPLAVSEAMLAQLITKVAAANRIGVNGNSLAHLIALRRCGLDGQPGRAGMLNNGAAGVSLDGTSPAVADLSQIGCDPRTTPIGDDRPFGSLQELMGLPGMTPQLYRALAPHLTVFSVSFAAFQIDNQGQTQSPSRVPIQSLSGAGTSALGLPQVDPNTASPDQIYEVLRQRYPNADPDLLGQFIANLIDRCDTDDLPTMVTVSGKTYTGIEINPCINEICPDPTTGENKGGQFIELYNPWSRAFSLSGWSLRGDGIQTQLQGSLPSGAFMVLTNNISNESNTGAQDNGVDGTFYNVFHKVGTGVMHQLIEVSGMQLPTGNGKVQLVNPAGFVVDEFEYKGGQSQGAVRSFQRHDPRLRVAKLLPATPLDVNSGAAMTPGEVQTLKIMEQWQNQPFRSALDVMLVSTAYDAGAAQDQAQATQTIDSQPSQNAQSTTGNSQSANSKGRRSPAAPGQTRTNGNSQSSNSQSANRNPQSTGSQSSTGSSRAYALPQLSGGGTTNLDLRLVDCFRIGAVIPPVAAVPASDLVGLNTDGASPTQLQTMAGSGQSGNGAADIPEPPRCEAIFGRINMNTASLVVLAALPGMDTQLLTKIAQVRNQNVNADGAEPASTNISIWAAASPLDAPHWRNLSDFIADENLWEGRPLYDRLDAVYAFSQLVTFHTLSVRVETASRPSESNIAAVDMAAKNADGTTAPATPAAATPADEAVTPTPTPGGALPAAAASISANARPTRVMRTERIIAADRGAPEAVTFGYVRTWSPSQVDPDTKYALKNAQAK